jgi:hypothetical protein
MRGRAARVIPPMTPAMSRIQQMPAPAARGGPWLQGSEVGWAIAFAVPYAAVFLLFAAYAIA